MKNSLDLDNNRTSIYLIGNTEHNFYKIGIAEDVAERFRQIATSCPYALSILEQYSVNDRALAFKVEKALYELYSSKRTRSGGEWFSEIDVTRFKELAEALTAMVIQKEEAEKDEKYVSEYTKWYNSTKQTRGEHPTIISLRLLGATMCPACSEIRHPLNAQEIAAQDNKIFCPKYGTLTIDELCDRATYERDRIQEVQKSACQS